MSTGLVVHFELKSVKKSIVTQSKIIATESTKPKLLSSEYTEIRLLKKE